MSLEQQENKETEQKKNNIKTVFIVIAVLVVIIAIGIWIADGGASGYPDKTYTCQVCHNEYKASSENGRSIRHTNMCTRCYKNYEYAQGMLD